MDSKRYFETLNSEILKSIPKFGRFHKRLISDNLENMKTKINGQYSVPAPIYCSLVYIAKLLHIAKMSYILVFLSAKSYVANILYLLDVLFRAPNTKRYGFYAKFLKIA